MTASMTLESVLARVLEIGTWGASAVIAAGILAHSTELITGGIAGLLVLPAIRVAILVGAFARQRDLRAAAIAACVLAILALGLVLG
jgi:uncharacterized membrane protein